VDSSGALLHRRGYRLQTAKAPMRETLAAALLAASGWPGDAPLLDPMCGAGTIAIEGAMLARRMAPGARREFAFMHWPNFDAALWKRMLEKAQDRVLPRATAPIMASDRDAGAIEAARANAERAGVAADIEFTHTALSGIAPPAASRGWLVTNPPYGVRVGDTKALRDLYAQLGNVARRSCPDWTIAMLSASAELERQVKVPFTVAIKTRNGGVPVRIVTARVAPGTA
jgi:putative N6-adenine-specific DNA methylase